VCGGIAYIDIDKSTAVQDRYVCAREKSRRADEQQLTADDGDLRWLTADMYVYIHT